MNTLFIDTSSSSLTVALIMNDKVISTREINSINEHSKYAVNEIKEVFNGSAAQPTEHVL
jgi:tRNA A37 threonylcarbamoyladenosine modification protein TsaB